MPRAAPFYRAEPFLLGCFVVLTALVIVPFWVVEFLPFLDIPQHLNTIAVMHHAGDPDFAFDAYFTIEAGSTQYLLYYLTCDLLSNLMGVEAANKVFISLYAVLLPWSLLAFLRAYDRPLPPAILAFPLVFNTFLFYGFINYVFALPFFFFGLALHARLLQAPTRWLQGGLVAVGLLIFYSHLQIFLVYVGALGLVTLMRWPGIKHFALRLLHVLPALLLFAWWGLASDGLAGGDAWESAVSKRYETLTGAEWEPLHHTLTRLPDRLLSVYKDDVDERITLGVGFFVLLFLLLRRGATGDWRTWLKGSFPEVLTLFVVIFYVSVPTSYKWVWPVNWRFAPLAALLFLTWARGDWHPWIKHGFTAALTLFAAWAIWGHKKHFQAFDAEAQNVAPILEKIEPQARVYALMFDSGSQVIVGPAYLHFNQYHPIRKGGMAAYSFAEAPQSPIRFRSESEGGPPPTPLRSEWKPHDFRFANRGRYYDYFLVRGQRGGWFRRAGFNRREVKLVAESGPWKLYHYERTP